MSVTTRTSERPADVLDALARTRERTLALAAALRDADLERQIDPLMSPLVWDLAHIAAYEDLWLVHRHADEPLLRADLAATYDAFETPRAVRGEIELLDTAGRARLPRGRPRARARRGRATTAWTPSSTSSCSSTSSSTSRRCCRR